MATHKINWNDKRIVILGAARQGIALARYLASCGALVTLSDMKPAQELTDEISSLQGVPVTFVLGDHPCTLLDHCDLLCLSGGVPIDLPIVLEARQRRVPLSNDSQVFFDLCPAPIIGITGSAGKTTTTTLVGEILKVECGAEESPVRVWVGGNIGNPLISEVDHIGPDDQVVLELSSFQLELMTRSPHIACITNITANHLDRHVTMQAYTAAKQHILDFQTGDDWAVLGADNTVTAQMKTHGRRLWFSVVSEPDGDGAWLDESGTLRIRIKNIGLNDHICRVSDLLLMGQHNVQNVLSACALAALAGASTQSMRSVATTFRGVAHRLQLVRELDGVRYYDDSIATAPERLMAALRCFSQPVVLLVGGRDKHLPWAEAVQLMANCCRHVVLFGEMAGLVQAEIERQKVALSTNVCDTLDEGVMSAAARALPGDVVLLSPGGTSYDAFKDFAARGDCFVRLVNGIE
jgi:UDP-N-acetylmuramoylalanine--D-glutamate ligase